VLKSAQEVEMFELIDFCTFETIEIYGIVPEEIMQMERSGELAEMGLIIVPCSVDSLERQH
jgi:3-polyprenyl-4-hydroxybenzoate decarboxylase